MTFSDDVLSSYLDGEAGPVLSREIEAAMQADPELVARMERLGRNDALLREAVDEALGDTPERLTQTLQAAPPADVLPFPPGTRRARLPVHHLAAASLAALAAGVVLGVSVAPGPRPLVAASREGVLEAGGRLSAALASTPSGVRAPVGGETLTVALSFRSRDGRMCRQFDLARDGHASSGVACRQGRDWRIEGWVAGRPASTGGYQTAGGPDDAAIGAMVDRLGLAQALDRTGEAAAIKAGWR